MIVCMDHLTLAGPKPPLHSPLIIARFFGNAVGRKIGSVAVCGGAKGARRGRHDSLSGLCHGPEHVGGRGDRGVDVFVGVRA